jgi:hypothetical protein
MNKKQPLIPKKKVTESARDQLTRFGDILNEDSNLNQLNPENYSSAQEYIQVLERAGVATVTEAMNSRSSSNGMFPSGWSYNDWDEPYPAILAQALVKSEANESVTDVCNMYYGSSKLSKEAANIFRQDALTNPLTKELMTEHGLINMGVLVRAEPQFMKKLFLTFSPQELQAFKQAEDGMTGDGAGMDKMLAQLGL